MNQKAIKTTEKAYEDNLEELSILNNQEMMEAILESDEAAKKGVKTWKLSI